MIVPWIQIHIDKAFAEVERLHPVTARTAENNDAQISAASKVFSEHFSVFFRRTAKLNFATPLSSKICRRVDDFSLRSVTRKPINRFVGNRRSATRINYAPKIVRLNGKYLIIQVKVQPIC